VSLSSSDRLLVRRSARRIVWQTTALLALAVLLVGFLAAAFALRDQNSDISRRLSQAIDDPDAVTDPPSGIVIYELHHGWVASSPELHGKPLDPRALSAVSNGDAAKSTDVHADDREYRVRTERRDDEIVQVGLDLTDRNRERVRLLTALALAALAGLCASAIIGWVIARRAIAPLGAALEKQRRFIADASHELRTPLTQVHTRAQLLEQGLRGQPELVRLERDAQQLVLGTRQLGDIIEEMLISAALRAEPQRTERVDLADSAARAVEAEQLRADEQGVTVTVEHDDGPHLASGSPTALRRVINSLLDNALGHTATGGHVTVELTRPKTPAGMVRVAVRDDGVGLGDADPSDLFERFARGQQGSGRRYGLGLALVREVVHAHRGTVTAENLPDGGSIFTVTLPAWPSSSE
jgi:signal transduction histidine kinase